MSKIRKNSLTVCSIEFINRLCRPVHNSRLLVTDSTFIHSAPLHNHTHTVGGVA